MIINYELEDDADINDFWKWEIALHDLHLTFDLAHTIYAWCDNNIGQYKYNWNFYNDGWFF